MGYGESAGAILPIGYPPELARDLLLLEEHSDAAPSWCQICSVKPSGPDRCQVGAGRR